MTSALFGDVRKKYTNKGSRFPLTLKNRRFAFSAPLRKLAFAFASPSRIIAK
jgi:hypothetical protein